MKSIEVEGKTVEEALEKALNELCLTKENANVEVLEQGSKGLFNVIGVKRAKIRVTSKYDYIEEARKFIYNILKSMELDAEINIIAQAAAKGLSTKGGKLYVTCSPCNDCCKAILASGIKEVIFKDLYDRETEGLEILANSGVHIRQLVLSDNNQVKENLQWA